MSIRDRLPFYILTLSLLFATLACNEYIYDLLLGESSSDVSQPTSGPAPDFEFTTFDGETYKLSDFQGNIVVINFWASWSIENRIEANILQSVWEDYQDRGVIFIGIAYLDSDVAAIEYIEQYGITYPNGHDTGTSIAEAYQITGVPETFVIDQDGNIAAFFIGPITEESLTTSIDNLLNE